MLMLIKITWKSLKRNKVMRAFLTWKILHKILPYKWAIKIGVWMWIKKGGENGN